VKKNLIWFAAFLCLTVFSLPPAALADDPDPNCDLDPDSCQPGVVLVAPMPHWR
jgi:hypothetical protein